MTKILKYLFFIIIFLINALAQTDFTEKQTNWSNENLKNKNKYSNFDIQLSEKEIKFLKNTKIDCVMAGAWPPFNFVKNGKNLGMSYDYWDLIREKTLLNSECRVVESFEKVLELIKQKRADITLSTTITDEKVEYSKFSLPYMSFPIAIATKLDKRYISDVAFLNNKKVAVAKSHSAYQILRKKYPDINFIETKNNLEAFKLLLKNDVYAVVDILPVLSQIISDYGFKDLKISGITDFNFDVRIMVRDDYEELLSIIDKGILSISEKQKQDIKNKWLSVKVENIIEYSKLWKAGLIFLAVLFILFYRHYLLNRHNAKLVEANKVIELKTIELQKKTRQLAKQKKLFEKIYYESLDGIFLTRIDNYKFIDCNDVAYKLLGYEDKEEFLQVDYKELFPTKQPDGTDSIEFLNKELKATLKKGSSHFELVHKKKDDEQIWLEVLVTSITLDGEKLNYVVWRDIQERKNMENKLNILSHNLEEKVQEELKKNEEKTKQLITQNRLAQMGEMISMIAHQWRQPLTAISATTNNILIKLMLDTKIEKEELENEVTLISDYAQHLSFTIDDFRNFFKADKEKIQTKVEDIIENTITIIMSSLDSQNIKLTTKYKCNKMISIYSTELNQVILNIVRNAQDALLENQIENPEIKIETYCNLCNAIILISDNAIGIPSENIDKIFNPYFSTKKSKDGTGIGLYMSKIIIEDHLKGSLSVSNSENGAIFKIELPLDDIPKLLSL